MTPPPQRPPARPRTTVTALLAALLLACAVPGAAQTWIPAETPASSNRRLLDPEFNRARGQFTWVDIVDGSIWIGGIDRATGQLQPEDGRAVLIEKSAAPPGGLGFTLNGPEWVIGGSTDRIVYTRMLPGVEPTPANAQIGAAFQRADGRWVLRTLSPERRLNAPYGSDIPGDPAPRITYNDAFGNHFWREIDRPETEAPVPGLVPDLLPAVRHLRSTAERGLVYPMDVGGTPQAVVHDVDRRHTDVVTTGPGKKAQPWAWQAPEFGGELALATIVDETSLEVHRRSVGADGTRSWSRVATLAAPLGGRFFSLEPFVYGGRSYAVMMVIVGSYPTSIWLAGLDPAAPFLRRLTPETPDRARADPEVFVTDRGPVVFFSRFNQNRGSYWLCVPCAEGLYRAETGIPVAR